MALKWELADFSMVSTRPSVVDIHVTLNLWQPTDNTQVDPPALTHPFTQSNVKTYVEGETPDSLGERWRPKLKSQIQEYIKDYKAEQGKINNVTPTWTTKVAEIDGEIAG